MKEMLTSIVIRFRCCQVELLSNLEVISVVVVHVGPVVVVHHVVSPVGVSVRAVPGISLGLSISRSLVVEGSVLSVGRYVPVVAVVHHVVSPVGVSVRAIPSISLSLRFGLSGSLAVVESVSLLHAGSVPVVHVPVVAVHHVVTPVGVTVWA